MVEPSRKSLFSNTVGEVVSKSGLLFFFNKNFGFQRLTLSIFFLHIVTPCLCTNVPTPLYPQSLNSLSIRILRTIFFLVGFLWLTLTCLRGRWLFWWNGQPIRWSNRPPILFTNGRNVYPSMSETPRVFLAGRACILKHSELYLY